MEDLGGSAEHLTAPHGPAGRHSGPVPEVKRTAAGEAERKVESEIHPGQRLFLPGRDLEGKAEEHSRQLSSHLPPWLLWAPAGSSSEEGESLPRQGRAEGEQRSPAGCIPRSPAAQSHYGGLSEKGLVKRANLALTNSPPSALRTPLVDTTGNLREGCPEL